MLTMLVCLGVLGNTARIGKSFSKQVSCIFVWVVMDRLHGHPVVCCCCSIPLQISISYDREMRIILNVG